jgi:AcrR family transcriptional regulator
VFGELGYETATVRDIIRRTGLAAGTFYNYYRSKEEVFAALADDGARRFAPILKGLRGTGPASRPSCARPSRLLRVHGRRAHELVRAPPGRRAAPARPGRDARDGRRLRRGAGRHRRRHRRGPRARRRPDYMAAACIAIAREVGDKMLERRPIDTGRRRLRGAMILDGLQGLPEAAADGAAGRQRLVREALLSCPRRCCG